MKAQLSFRKITLMKGKALRRHILHRKKAASFLLKLFKKTRTSPTHEKFFSISQKMADRTVSEQNASVTSHYSGS